MQIDPTLSHDEATMGIGDRLVLLVLAIAAAALGLIWVHLSSIADLCDGGCATESGRDAFDWSGVLLSIATLGVASMMFVSAAISGHKLHARGAGRGLLLGLIAFALWLFVDSYL